MDSSKPIPVHMAARMLNVSRRSIYNWMEWGILAWTHSNGTYHSRMVRLSDIYVIRPHLNPANQEPSHGNQ